MPPRKRRPFRWSTNAARYIDARGRFVNRRAVRDAIDDTISAADRDAADLMHRLRRGEIDVGRWHHEMRTLVKDVHLYNAAAAAGGWAQLTPADYGRIGQRVRHQYGYLAAFADELTVGVAPLGPRSSARARLYTQSGRSTYTRTDRALHRGRGATEEASFLGKADHCLECVDEASRGWVEIGTLVPVGERTCLSTCACYMDFR